MQDAGAKSIKRLPEIRLSLRFCIMQRSMCGAACA